MKKNKSFLLILLLTLIGVLIMAYVDAILKPNYALKSLIKLFLFLSLPFMYGFVMHDLSFTRLFIIKKKQLLIFLSFGIIIYGFILGAYFLLGPFFDLTKITTSLQGNIGVNKHNFIFVALYISFINSLLEEFFFRGFAFLTLKKYTTRRIAYLVSAIAFSLYHVAIMTSWFTIYLYLLIIISLFGAGILFNFLDEKTKTIYPSWMVHMFANFAINTIGFILFGMI